MANVVGWLLGNLPEVGSHDGMGVGHLRAAFKLRSFDAELRVDVVHADFSYRFGKAGSGDHRNTILPTMRLDRLLAPLQTAVTALQQWTHRLNSKNDILSVPFFYLSETSAKHSMKEQG